MADLSSRVAEVFSARWPAWRQGDVVTKARPLHIHLSDHLQKVAAMMERPGMGRPADTILALRSQSRKCSGDTAAFERFWAGLEHDLIGLIYASDLIDGAGTTLSATAKLCKAVFRGEDVDGQIDVDDAEYQQHIGHLQATCRKADLASVIVSRRQTICHAKALVYMIRKVVLEKQPLSEAVMLKTHRILHEGMDTRGKAGRYRGDEVEVAYNEVGEKKRSGMCIRASIVPAYMRLVLMHLADENREAEAGGDVDPYWLGGGRRGTCTGSSWCTPLATATGSCRA
ncbi:Filamentation induced by cAMP/death on curing-related protein [Ophiocordyceps sinensis CO18]|uniref:Filamentation induced by cAMP/death on curing-related protein n=1 Tax=Ophiocordyceps sinensis (strain Co18 / CGMCC 3.14243) TaxID=911162 RepID=T5AFH0_OPHSC|nr:Filamentation induced by cAMP/death on curing-related protein [Ophiocordyceps sinensis CO18]